MNSREHGKPFAYTLSECLIDFVDIENPNDQDNITYILDDAQKSRQVDPDAFSRYVLEFDNYVVMRTAISVVQSYGVGTFATLLKRADDERPLDDRLLAWRNFGIFEEELRSEIAGHLHRRLSNLWEITKISRETSDESELQIQDSTFSEILALGDIILKLQNRSGDTSGERQ